MRVLFIGGTGIISSGCTQVALEQGITVFHLNRGESTTRPAPYDPTYIPLHGGFTVIDRMRRGLPVIVHGDGTSLSVIFDNTKIKRVVPGFRAVIPFAKGAREIASWFNVNSSQQQVDPEFNSLVDRILGAYQAAWL